MLVRMSRSILVIAGTNRPKSNARRVAEVILANYRRSSIEADLFSLQDMPAEAFAPESYASKPASVQAIQQRILNAAGLHLIVPEYNGSFPGVLKYFVDLLKFPESFERKPVAFVGESAGTWGALRAVEQLQMIFAYRNAFQLPDRVFIPQVNAKFDAEGQLSDADIAKRLSAQCEAFTKFVSKVAG
jgi:chromate reductase, NAD(P)H dehydrogenase (quinone)